VLETPDANVVLGPAWLQSTYTIRLNSRHKLVGHVLSGRYKAQLVEGGGNGYLRTAADYVHLNPARANLLAADDRLFGPSLEQFPVVFGCPPASATVAEGGALAGRTRDTTGYSAEAAGI